MPNTESASPRFAAIETWSTADLVDGIVEGQFSAIAAVRAAAPAIAAAIDAAAARLAAGGTIAPHTDGAGSNLVTHKIHVPLITNPDALFLAGGVWTHLEAGQAYEVNNIGRHGVVNRGAQDRIHLIFEVYDAAGLESAA